MPAGTRTIRCTRWSARSSSRSDLGTSASCAGPTWPSPRTGSTLSGTGRSGDVGGRAVLLIDDTWTTGANAQSAAAALKAAGARRVAALVIGRYVNREWGHNDRRLRRLPQPFDWGRCALCDGHAPGATSDRDGGGRGGGGGCR